MNHLILNLVLCGILVVLAVAAGLYRKWLEDHCDGYIHLHNDSHDQALVAEQSMMCKRLEAMGKVRTALIVAVILYAVAIVALVSYNAWNSPGM